MKIKPITCDISEVLINGQRFIPFKKTTLSAAIHGESFITGAIFQDNQVVLSFSGSCEIEKKQRGRKKATAKHMAVHFYYLLLKSRKKSDGYSYGKIKELFNYRDDRELRRICKRGPDYIKGGIYLKAMGTPGKNNAVVMLFEKKDSITVDANTIVIRGNGWGWREGDTEAVYGHWSGTGAGTFDPSALEWDGEEFEAEFSPMGGN